MTASRTIRRWMGRVLVVVLAVVLVAAVGMVVWSQAGVYPAEAGPVNSVRGNSGITVSEDSAAMVLEPAGSGDAGAGNAGIGDAGGEPPQVGLVFYPGAKVEAEAYAARLVPLVTEQGVTVVIVKPWLHLAMVDLRGLDAFTGKAPGVDSWIVGGHSLGGVRACQLAPEADGLLLFASYCARDLSGSDVATLSLAGSEDGLSTPASVAQARHKLPADAELVEIPGAAHSSFGDYGVQDGDGTPTIDDAAMDAAIGEATARLVDQL